MANFWIPLLDTVLWFITKHLVTILIVILRNIYFDASCFIVYFFFFIALIANLPVMVNRMSYPRARVRKDTWTVACRWMSWMWLGSAWTRRTAPASCPSCWSDNPRHRHCTQSTTLAAAAAAEDDDYDDDDDDDDDVVRFSGIDYVWRPADFWQSHWQRWTVGGWVDAAAAAEDDAGSDAVACARLLGSRTGWTRRRRTHIPARCFRRPTSCKTGR